MKQLLVAALFATAAFAEQDYQAMFEAFKASFSRSYADPAEETKRFSNFVESMKTAESHQAANPLAEFGMNEFSDWSAAEFKSRHNLDMARLKMEEEPRTEAVFTEEFLAAARGRQIDWRQKGVVTEVKSQSQCGSCWAFSATANIESQWAVAGHPLTTASEQEIVSCDTTDGGCYGGWPLRAFKWLLHARNGTISTAASLPYTQTNRQTHACPSHLSSDGPTINGYVYIPQNEDALAAWVYANGTASVLVDATSIIHYQRGILTNAVSRATDHAVLAVGFDDVHVPPYWIVKNSWGSRWGENGYVRIAKGTNQCLIAQSPVSVTVAPKRK